MNFAAVSWRDLTDLVFDNNWLPLLSDKASTSNVNLLLESSQFITAGLEKNMSDYKNVPGQCVLVMPIVSWNSKLTHVAELGSLCVGRARENSTNFRCESNDAAIFVADDCTTLVLQDTVDIETLDEGSLVSSIIEEFPLNKR